MVKSAKSIFPFLQERVVNVGIVSLVLAALEQILDEEFVCPCEYIYNIVICVVYGTVPAAACFVLTLFFTSPFSETKDRGLSDNFNCNTCLYAFLTATIWLFLFFADGRYLACALSVWEGVYTRNDSLAIVKWCMPTGNETSVYESQQITLKWISISQILGFIIISCVIIILACVSIGKTASRRKILAAEQSKFKLHGRLSSRKFSFDVEEVTRF